MYIHRYITYTLHAYVHIKENEIFENEIFRD